MGDAKGFISIKRQAQRHRPKESRVKDFRETILLRAKNVSESQAARCMDCGTPFCLWACPLGSYIPEWNDFIFSGRWDAAYKILAAANNFPEFTGRLCPALCEYSCALGINDDPVTVRENELSIIEYAFSKGWVKPSPPAKRTGKKAAIVGSGPAALACADQLNKAGHRVTVFERDKTIGGILRYGIPDFKIEKSVIERRLNILKSEGILFEPGTDAGVDFPASRLIKEFDAVCLAAGSRVPRDLNAEGRGLDGIHFAMDYLSQSNRIVSGEKQQGNIIHAKGKKVVVIGGGDTGADCVGTAHRQGAESVMQLELLPRPPECRGQEFPWPKYPLILKTSTSHEEGGAREWAVMTKKFTGENGKLRQLSCVRLDFSRRDSGSCPVMNEIPGSEFTIDADLVILAMGFMHPEKNKLIESLGIELDSRGLVKTDSKNMTSVRGVFAAGDMRRGQSLIVWAIHEGRRTAQFMDEYLNAGTSSLPAL